MMVATPIAKAVAAFFLALQPPPDWTISQWADERRMLSAEASAEPGRWVTARAPYQREIMDVASDPRVETIVLMTSAQIGKSELLLNVIGAHIDYDPSPILCLQPTLEMAEAFSKDRIAPMLRDSPALKNKVKDARARDSGNTLLHKTFNGGHLTLAGANSPASLASRPIRIVLCDEVDRYPESAGTEGDPVKLASKRTSTFWNKKIILVSTPTIKWLSRIESAFEKSDKRRYFVPCPDCGEKQMLKWSQVKWPEGQPEDAHYVCEHCGSCIDHRHKAAMLKQGEWRATAPFKKIAGFHLSELYSPWRKWGDVALDFLEAMAGGTEMLKTWVNTSLGETWEERGESLDPTGLMARCEEFAEELPIYATSVGTDVQGDRIEATRIGWGEEEEAWVMDHVVLPGDTAQPAVWADFDALLKEWQPDSVGIDSGFNATQVYEFCAKRKFCHALKGKGGFSLPLIEDEKKRVKRRLAARKRGGYPVETIGVDGGKVLVYSRLRNSTPGPGHVHFTNSGDCDEEYFAQLTAEKLVTKQRLGRTTQEWVKKQARNEALDCFLYALVAKRLANLDITAIKAKREKAIANAALPAVRPPQHDNDGFGREEWNL